MAKINYRDLLWIVAIALWIAPAVGTIYLLLKGN